MLRISAGPFLSSKTSEKGARKRPGFLMGAIAIGSVASPALAEFEPTTRLVECGAQTCLEVSGHREDSASIIRLNGNLVSAEGENGWRVRLPVETVRQWSAPHARTIEVSLHHPETAEDISANADLPIGLLGDITQLAVLEVRAP